MSEIKPMLLEEIELDTFVEKGDISILELTDANLERYKSWIFQEKQNGVRVIAHFRQGKLTALRGRKNNNLLIGKDADTGNPAVNLFPELMGKIGGDFDAIIDAELVAFDSNHKSLFYNGINQRDKVFRKESFKNFPVCLVAFDILYLNGEVVASKPYLERYALLEKLAIADSKVFEVAKNISNPKDYWKVVIADNREGMVVKNPNAKYEVDTRSKNCLKLKNYKKVDVLIERTEKNNAGTKVYGKCVVGGVDIEVEAQIGGVEPSQLPVGDKVPVVYLDIVGNKMIQPHKVKGFGLSE